MTKDDDKRGPHYDPAIVNESISIRRLAEEFGGEFHRSGSTLFTRCVFRDHEDRTPSFAIYEDTNHFYCYGCQRGGDPLALISYFHDWTARKDFRKALLFGARFGGVAPDADDAAIEEARRIVREKRQAQAAREGEERRAKEEKAAKRWLAARPLTVDDLPYRYFRDHRGVDLAKLAHWPNAVRYDPAFRWNHGMRDAPDWRSHHVIVTAMTRAARITATHQTFLTPDGALNREIGQKGRIVLGSPRGAMMMLARGKSGLSPKDAYAKHGMDDMLAIAEGLEDGLSVASLFPEWRVGAAYSLDNMGNIDPPDCAGEVTLCAENDASAAAKDALARVQAKMLSRAKGRTVKVAFPPPGFKDWNEIDQAHE